MPGLSIHEGSLVADCSRRAIGLKRVVRRAASWFARLVFSASTRFLVFFGAGVAVTMGWQSYRDAGREAITNWCSRWAPQVPSAAKNIVPPSEDLVSVSPDLLKTTSLNLTAVRESIDKVAGELAKLQTVEKLAAELARLQAIEAPAVPDKTAAPSLAPGLPPASKPPSRSR